MKGLITIKHTLSVLVENQAGVLSKVSGLFSRRGFNIDSLAVGVTDNPSISRMTIVADGDDYIIEQLEKQLNKLIPVIRVRRLEPGKFLSCELALIKVISNAQQRAEVMKIAELTGARIVNVSLQTLTLEICDIPEKIDTLLNLLKPYGIKEVVQTGVVAIETE